MLVTDRHQAGGEDALVWIAQQAVQGGADIVQLREKDMDAEALTELAERILDALGGRGRLVINGSAEVALEAGAQGVHLPEDARFDRPIDEMLVGRSVHSSEAAKRARSEGADYVVAGHIYETDSHPDIEPRGTKLISDVAAVVSVPVLAIGGIRTENVPEVVAAGASGIAVKSAILIADDPYAAASALRSALDSEWLANR
jgi:thiamine-phosphate diphosphorylase